MEPERQVPDSEAVLRGFERQAIACTHLGSPFTARTCRLLAARLTRDSAFGTRLLDWPGHVLNDALALRAAGALHALKRSGRAPELAAVYPPHEADDAALARALDGAIAVHDGFLAGFLDSPPQTNEVSRSNAILGGCLHIAARTGLPLDLHEIGASAGLNLVFDTYDYDLDGSRWGDHGSAVKIIARWEGTAPPLAAPLAVASRSGCDVNPLDARNEAHRERLLSYIWPDQTARLARIAAALDASAQAGTRVEKADAASWVEAKFGAPAVAGKTRVLCHTIVWQYLDADTRARIEAAMARAAAAATTDAPVAWLAVEADKTDPMSAGIRLRVWPSGEDVELGRADFHGRWSRWSGQGA